ncbi:MAG: MepB family protein [Bacteroidota bacterium]
MSSSPLTENSFAADLNIVKDLIYDPCAYELTDLKQHSESAEYGACSFVLSGKKVQQRFSKITPTKTGQFVTVWKRNRDGITAPFDFSDDLDFIIIIARSGDQLGQFTFPKLVLAEKEIITRNGSKGKRGIRVYPPWDNTTNKQAEKTQNWQQEYFFTIEQDNTAGLKLIKKLISGV